MKPTGTPVTHSKHSTQPLQTTTAVPNPGDRYALGPRIAATLTAMTPGSHQSFLVDHVTTAHQAAKKYGFQICTRREGEKFRVWRLA